MLHVGTDEAGYGPLLGPLVIVATLFQGGRAREEIRLPGIADSKEVYARGGRDALARLLGPYLGPDLPAPLPLSHLLACLSVREDPRSLYDWYGEVSDPVPAGGVPPEGFAGILLNPLCEREFNAGCLEAGGKGHLLSRETMRLVRAALERHPGADAEVVCDKHGGRNRYAALLLSELGPSTIVPEVESAALSRYRLTIGGRKLRIRFEAKADRLDALVSLASLAAKYVRELFMEGLNDFFARRVEGLRPTAGYTTDGRRFLADLARGMPEFDEAAAGIRRLS